MAATYVWESTGGSSLRRRCGSGSSDRSVVVVSLERDEEGRCIVVTINTSSGREVEVDVV